MFTEDFLYDGKRFNNFTSLAEHLATNFRKSLSLITDGSLFALIEREDKDLALKLNDLVKDFMYQENVLTLTLYLMENSVGIVTPKYHFDLNRDIAKVMKQNYPQIVDDVRVLFKDKVLAHIYWNEYEKTNDQRYKRNYTFMLHVYENRMYDFTYFYYLFLNLEATESVRFTLDQTKMRNVKEVATYIMNHQERANIIIDEILGNPFILALIALEAGIDEVAKALNSKNKLEILIPLQKFADVNFIGITKQTMAYWLLDNYKNYNFESDEAKLLLVDYGKLEAKMELNSLSDYVAISDEANKLYERFVALFNYNRLCAYKTGIEAQEDYYLNYRYHDSYVCKKFLMDNNLFDQEIHTENYRNNIEKEILINELEKEKVEIKDFKNAVSELAGEKNYDVKFLKHRNFLCGFYMVLIVATAILGLFVKLYDFTNVVNIVLVSLLGLAFLVDIIALGRYCAKLGHAELVLNALNGSDISLKDLDLEEENVINSKPGKNKFDTLMHLEEYKKNRQTDLEKIKVIVKKKTTVSNAFLVIVTILMSIPFFFIFNTFAAQMMGKEDVLGIFIEVRYLYNFNLVYVIFALVDILLVSIFHKKNFGYYLILVLLAISIVCTLVI